MPDHVVLTTVHRARLAALADVLLPATEDLPAPSELALEGRWIDQVLAARRSYAGPLVSVLDAEALQDPADEVGRLAAEEPGLAEVLLAAVSAAYYAHPKVRRRLGYPGQRSALPRADEADHFLRDGLLDPVTSRGRLYRDVA